MSAPVVVLVGVQLAENLGAVARVMANFGLQELRLVAPEASPEDARAVAMATHGADVLAAARTYATLADALGDVQAAWGTAALPRAREAGVWHPRAMATHLRQSGLRHALVFGPERTGLSAEDTARLDGVVRIPTDAACRALNLAQAVAILAWEWSSSEVEEAARVVQADAEPAPVAAFDAFFGAFGDALVAAGWLSDATLRPNTLTTLRQALRRAGFTRGELGTLHGAVRALTRGPGRSAS